MLAPCRDLSWAAPWRWLALAWRDFRAAPGLSLLWGCIITALCLLVSALAWWMGRFALLAVLVSGFVFVAPMLGVGLYAISRSLQQGQVPSFGQSSLAIGHLLGQAGVFALCQGIVVLVWARAGMMAMAFFPTTDAEQHLFFEALRHYQVLTDGHGSQVLWFLLLGSAFGAVFALICFAMTALSLPMLVAKKVDMITAILSSVNACLRNPAVMLQWAVMIVLLLSLGLATAFLAHIVIMPILGYAAWHAWREAIDASAWPDLELKQPDTSGGFVRG
jgi:uncharacterized membrane protein